MGINISKDKDIIQDEVMQNQICYGIRDASGRIDLESLAKKLLESINSCKNENNASNSSDIGDNASNSSDIGEFYKSDEEVKINGTALENKKKKTSVTSTFEEDDIQEFYNLRSFYSKSRSVIIEYYKGKISADNTMRVLLKLLKGISEVDELDYSQSFTEEEVEKFIQSLS